MHVQVKISHLSLISVPCFPPDSDVYALLLLLYVFGKHDATFDFITLLFAWFVLVEFICKNTTCDLSRCYSYQLPVMFPEILSPKLV